MKVYYIAVTSWDGSHAYTLDYIRPFLSKQKRDEAYEKMKLSPAYKKGDIGLNTDEDEVEDAPEEVVEARVFDVMPYRSVVMYDAYYPNGVPHNDRGVIGKLIFVKED